MSGPAQARRLAPTSARHMQTGACRASSLAPHAEHCPPNTPSHSASQIRAHVPCSSNSPGPPGGPSPAPHLSPHRPPEICLGLLVVMATVIRDPTAGTPRSGMAGEDRVMVTIKNAFEVEYGRAGSLPVHPIPAAGAESNLTCSDSAAACKGATLTIPEKLMRRLGNALAGKHRPASNLGWVPAEPSRRCIRCGSPVPNRNLFWSTEASVVTENLPTPPWAVATDAGAAARSCAPAQPYYDQK
jgi:hypothetical protein